MAEVRSPANRPAGERPAEDRATALGRALRDAEPRDARPLMEAVTRLAAEGLLVERAGVGTPATIRGVACDSRRVTPGAVFVAVPGARGDGHDHAAAAVDAGAAALVVERPLPSRHVPQVIVASSRRALATIACWWYADPSHELAVVGVTGTDGKTSTSRLAVAALEATGTPTGMVSTAALRIGGVDAPNPVHATTPEAPDLQRLLRAMVVAGDRVAVVETTSHGLALDRVSGVAYDAAILTNLTHEHLELHGTFEAYRAAKLRLFESLAAGPANPSKGPGGARGAAAWPRTAVVNADDPSAPWFVDAARAARARVITYGAARDADLRAIAVDQTPAGLRATVDGPAGRMELRLGLLGRFNVWNALAVLAFAQGIGLDLDAALAGLATAPAVTGRMERLDRGQPFTVVVDYAHSPASLRAVLDQLDPIARAAGGGLIAVFGSAGERDVLKRPMMGGIAGERCRLVVVTDEDPRGEDPESILDEIADGAVAAGMRVGDDLYLVADRRAAIAAAFGRARPGDVVLLAGKGHEASIIYADGPVPWDERRVAEEELARLGHATVAPAGA